MTGRAGHLRAETAEDEREKERYETYLTASASFSSADKDMPAPLSLPLSCVLFNMTDVRASVLRLITCPRSCAST